MRYFSGFIGRTRCLWSALLLLTIPGTALSERVLFEEDLQNKIVGAPSPEWSWDIQEGPRSGMMIGEGDIYEIVQGDKFLSHQKSLRMNFSGRNNFCNTCGGFYTEIDRISDGKACASVEQGVYENYVYNQTNFFSTWEIIEKGEGYICTDVNSLMKSGIYEQPPELSLGHSIYVPYVCGKSGTVGRDLNRRSDCNKAINYLDGSNSHKVGFGEQIARRFYLYIDENATLPDVGIKLGYSHWLPNGSRRPTPAALIVQVQRDMTLDITLPDTDRRVSFGANNPDAPRATVGEWIYFEEVFTRESSEGATDGSYELYMGPASAGASLLEPIVVETGMNLGEFTDMSIGGNWQHTNNVSGYVYFDEIKISTHYMGPVNPPKAPE